MSEQEDLIVWMRTAALPTFRKLYGKIEVDLDVNDEITIVIENNYNTYQFGGRKSVVLSTTTWIGGKNDFLGIAYILIGGLSWLYSLVFLIMYMMRPRLGTYSTHSILNFSSLFFYIMGENIWIIPCYCLTEDIVYVVVYMQTPWRSNIPVLEQKS